MDELLSSLYADHPCICPLTTRMPEEIDEICQKTQMKDGDVSVRYERTPNYFQFNKLMSGETTSLGTLNNQNLLKGLGTVSIRDGYINGEICQIGYLSGLRMLSERVASKAWRAYLKDYVYRSMKRDKPVLHHHCVVFKENLRAIQSLVSGLKPDLVVEPLWKYEIKQVFFKITPAFGASSVVDHAQELERNALRSFLTKQQQGKLFGYDFQSEFNHRMLNWPGFSIKDFLVARDEQGNIEACCLPWSPGSAKKIFIDWMSPRLHKMKRMTDFLKPLTGVALPSEGEEFKVKFLTHLEFKNGMSETRKGKIIRGFIEASRKSGDYFHSVSFFEDDHLNLSKHLKGYVTQSTDAVIYSIRHHTIPKIDTSDSIGIGFEIAIH